MAAPLLRCTKQEEVIKCEFVNSVIHDILMNTHANDVSIVTVTVIVSFFASVLLTAVKNEHMEGQGQLIIGHRSW